MSALTLDAEALYADLRAGVECGCPGAAHTETDGLNGWTANASQ